MKKLSIIVPIYKTEKYITKHMETWKKASSVFDVYFIQDSEQGGVEKLAMEAGAFFHKKKNGNWGSVINYAKGLNLKTPYIKIVDGDDIIFVDQIIKTLNESNGEDLLLCGVEYIYTNKARISTFENYRKIIPFIHSMIIKTSVFQKIKDLPEGMSYMDVLLKVYFYEESNSIFKSSNVIYKYYRDLPGNSMDPKVKNTTKNYYITKIILNEFLNNVPKKNPSLEVVLSKLENGIWQFKDNKIYKKAYKKIWSLKIRGFQTNYFFVLIAGIFKKKI